MSDMDVLRRIAERGLEMAHAEESKYVDLFQHMLDELERAEKEVEGMKHQMHLMACICLNGRLDITAMDAVVELREQLASAKSDAEEWKTRCHFYEDRATEAQFELGALRDV